MYFSVPFSFILMYTYYHGIIDHSGITFKRQWWQPWQPDCIFHDNHHQYFHVNFGFNIEYWDKVNFCLVKICIGINFYQMLHRSYYFSCMELIDVRIVFTMKTLFMGKENQSAKQPKMNWNKTLLKEYPKILWPILETNYIMNLRRMK